MSATDLLEPTGPRTSLRPAAPTVYRAAPGAAPHEVQRGIDGQLYGWVRVAPVSREVHAAESPAGGGDEPPRPRRGKSSPETGKQGRRSRAGRKARYSVPDLDGYDERPDPMNAKNTAEFIGMLDQYRTWADLSFRDVEFYSDGKLSRSTVQAALKRNDRLPHHRFVMDFVHTCSADDSELQRWSTAYRRLRTAEKRAAGAESTEDAVERLTGERPPADG
ncbi:hypothetical protein [Nocardiopsis coralliicola]